ncbi:MAG: site-specific integrase [Clostridia bacterium]|nr:site-specific integrase [Clostridia bacterium]
MNKNGNNEGSIRKRANGYWEARYSDGFNEKGKQIQRSIYGKTRKEVADKLNAVLYQKQCGDYVTPNKMILSEWLTMWLHNYAQITVRPSTYISYEGYVYNHINPTLGNRPIQQITPVMVQNFYNQKFECGRVDGSSGLSPKTIRNLHNMFHQALEQAKINGIIRNNPTDGAVIPKQEKKEMRVLSVSEQMALMNVIPLHRLGFAIMLDLATGLRIGELCALKWSDVNFKKHTIKISRTLQRIKKSMNEIVSGECTTAILEGNVKTNSGFREIPLPDKIFERLLEHRQNQLAEINYYGELYQNNNYVFAMPLGNCVEPHTMRDALNYLLEVAGIEHINFHALRHTFATRAIESGVNIKTISDILGHSQVQITMDLYCHSSLDLMRDSMNKVAELF